MALDREEREELTNLYAEMKFGRAFGQDREAVTESQKRCDEAVWAAMCHTTGRCGLAVNQQYPDTPQARIYELLLKALRP